MSPAAIIKRVFGAAAMIAALALGSAAPAQPVKTDHLEVELISQGEATPGGETYVALRHRMADGWHTYWRNSGDSGEATKIAWTLPPGWTAGDFVWATPQRLPFSMLMNYGYSDEVILPVAITAPKTARPGETVTLKAHATFLVCKDICVPEEANLSLDVKVAQGAPKTDPKWAPVIARALEQAPKPSGLVAAATLQPGALKISVTGEPLKGGDFPLAYFFPFSGAAIDHAQPQAIERGPEGLTLTLVPAATLKPGPLAGVLSVGDAAYEIEAVEGPVLAGATGLGAPKAVARLDKPKAGLGLPAALALAFLGGLILNLMPCVFPVLSMKAASLVLHAHNGRTARTQGLAFLAGVLVTFLVLAALLILARAAGQAAGWGFQLQSPPVVAGLCLLMLLIALNLAGLFEVGTSVQGAGSGLAGKSGLAGAFFTGALAVVVAAPCTAPFMAGALGYAVSQPPARSLMVFAALGLGFAAPFTMLAFAPGLLRRLPRPGPWMSVFKTVLAFPMFGAAAWLAWVFASQAGTFALAALFGAALILAMGAWLFGLGQRQFSPAWKIVLQLALPVALIAAIALLVPVAKPQAGDRPVVADPSAALPREAWSPAKVVELQAAGRPVFVDFTADWCVTCKVNEKTSLASKGVADAFVAANAAYLVADWTNRDATIAAALAEHDRAGVPLYLMYPANGGAPKILPQLLTEGLVKAALKEAAG